MKFKTKHHFYKTSAILLHGVLYYTVPKRFRRWGITFLTDAVIIEFGPFAIDFILMNKKKGVVDD